MSRSKPDFFTWLAQQLKRDDPIGDIARHMLDDPNWPDDATTFEDGHAYLRSVQASARTIDALRQARNEWREL